MRPATITKTRSLRPRDSKPPSLHRTQGNSSSDQLDNLLQLFTDDVIYEDVALGAVNVGKDALRAFAEKFLLVFPDVTLELSSTFSTATHGGTE
jgi:hypothetical protein